MRKALLVLAGVALATCVAFGPAAARHSCYIDGHVTLCMDGIAPPQAPARLALADAAEVRDLGDPEPASERAEEEGGIDIYKAVVALGGLIGAALSTILGLVLKGLLTKLRIDLDIGNGHILDAAIKRGIDWAIVTADGLDGVTDGKITIKARSEIVAQVGNYLAGKVPEVLAYFGLSPDDPQLKERIEARLKPYLAA